ncbi:MAG: VWA domain-containing protein [Blastocatellia bacterium]
MILFWLEIGFVQTASQAQQAPPSASQDQKQDVVRITTQLVQIDAIVTDKKGQHVDNLSEADFELTVDGKRQPLTYFKLVRLVDPKPEDIAASKTKPALPLAQMPAKQIDPEKVRRTIALVVDDLGLSFSSVAYAKDALKKFVTEQMQEGDLVAIVRTSGGFGIYQQFTSDKRILFAAIEKLKFALNGRRQIPFTIAEANGPFSTPSERDDQRRANPRAAARKDAEKAPDEFRENHFAYGTLGALNYVIRALRPLPGRKVAVILSDGLLVNAGRGSDLSQASALQRSLLSLSELANRSSVAFYSVNVEGLLAPFGNTAIEGLDQASSTFSGGNSFHDGLRTLAYETGGQAYYNNNRTDLMVQKAVDDNRSFYLLGFDPEDENFDRKYHEIKIVVKQPDLLVRTRRGFFGIEDNKAREIPKTREAQLLSAMFSPFGAKDIPYQITSLFFSSKKGEPVIRSYFHIDCSKLKFKDEADGQKSLTLELANFTFNEAGMVAESYAQAFTLRFDEARYRRALAEGLTYLDDFVVKKPGAYHLRSALRDAGSGLLGTSSQFIQIPNLKKDKLTISGIILNVVVNGEAAKPVNTAAIGGDVLEAEVMANPAARRFASNSEIEYQAAIYNPQPDRKTGKPSLKLRFELYRDGKPIFQSPERPVRSDRQVDPKWLDCGGRFQLKNFSAGEYLLRLVVKDELREGKDSVVEQWIDFTVK